MKRRIASITRNSSSPVAALRGSAGRAFTVVELLVAIGVVAIVSVGLAAIFDAVGKTVQGGRRVSVLSQYATMVEDRLRKDFASIDPNSFLMIRQQSVDMNNDGIIDPLIGGNDGVEAYPGQAKNERRPRRIDEIVFFCRGEFESARTPIAPGLRAQSHQARVYIGMGEKMEPSFDSASPAGLEYLKPKVAFRDPNAVATIMQPLGKTGFANQYANEWTLLRHVTLLQQPRMTGAEVPSFTALFGSSAPAAARLTDKDGQISLQPAAATIFRTITHSAPFPGDLLATQYLWMENDNDPFPSFATGIVDIATMDLTEIRSYVLGAGKTPAETVLDVSTLAGMGNSGMLPSAWMRGRRTIPAPPSQGSLDSLERMHLWMSDAFPTQSIQASTGSPTGVGPIELGFLDSNPIPDTVGQRIRYEPQPVGMRNELEQTPASADAALQDAYQRAAQAMLTAHNFVPRCSEFIVEWSFGRLNPVTNELIWHGPPRDGVPATQLSFYPLAADGNYPNGNPDLRLEEGNMFEFQYLDTNTPPALHREQRFYPFTDRLIYGASPSRTTTPAAVTSYFGYIDPMFNPVNPIQNDPSTSVDETGGITGTSVSVPLMQCPRPKLIRITMSIADPRDPKLEETFQFVLDVPQTRPK